MDIFGIDKTKRHGTITCGPRKKYRSSQDATYDKMLKEKWDASLDKGLVEGYFKHRHDVHNVKDFPGKRGWVGVYCPARVEGKREPPSFDSVIADFPSGFNFNKIKSDEHLYQIENNGILSRVIINNSPYAHCHSLIVPEPEKEHVQLLSGTTIEVALELMMQSNQIGYKILFNSVCACASVNHLHLHQYYTDYRIPAEDIECEPIMSIASKVSKKEEGLFVIKPSYPVRGLVLEVHESLIKQTALFMTQMCNKLAEDDVPHNVAFIRGSPLRYDPTSPAPNDDYVVRVYLWPRRPTLGKRSYEDFNCAVTELVGHCYFGDKKQFDEWTEDDIHTQLSGYDVGDDNFEKFCHYAKAHFTQIFK